MHSMINVFGTYFQMFEVATNLENLEFYGIHVFVSEVIVCSQKVVNAHNR